MATSVVTPDAGANAPPPSAPPSTSAPGASFESKMDSVFDRISPDAGPDAGVPDADATPPEVVTADADAGPPSEEPLIDDSEGGEPPVEAAPPEPSPEEIEYAPEVQPDKVSADGKLFHCTKTKWERLQASDKTVQQLRELDPGITVDAVKDMRGRTLVLDDMLAGYDAGDPAYAANWAGFLAGVDEQGRPTRRPEAVTAFADSVMARVAQHYPAAFKAVENKILHTLARRQYDKYSQTRDEADKHLAWNLDFMARGDYRRDIDQQPQQQANPVAAERAQLQRERNTFEQLKRQDHHTRVSQAVNAAQAEARSVVDQAIESALSIIPATTREKKATEFKHAMRDLRENFEEATKANPNFTTPYNTLLSKLQSNPTTETRSDLVAFVKRWADWQIGRKKPEVVSRFNEAVTGPAKAAIEKQEKLQERREPGGSSGTPVQRATLMQKLKAPSKTPEEYNSKVDALFDAISRR